MPYRFFSPALCAAILFFSSCFLALPAATAQQETVLHNFNGPGDGAEPEGALLLDKAGNLYGTTVRGGTDLGGIVYELSPAGSGWTERILHNFNPNAQDGSTPLGKLVMDSKGNLYGTTSLGGGRKLGTVFELSPQASGSWSEKIIHTFLGGSDGRSPKAGLIIDNKGNLYGTTYQGGTGKNCGALACGTVFELSLKSGGVWTEKILYSFKGGTSDGQNPSASLRFDSKGNLYGTTVNGGTGGSINSGTVFRLSPNGSGGWTETVLHSFLNNGTDGTGPMAQVTFDAAGNLYGTTAAGGMGESGVVFKLSPGANGHWNETVLHSFGGSSDGNFPVFSGVTFDSSGNLFGTLEMGGANGEGAVFKMTPESGGGWSESIYYSFSGPDGNGPITGVIFDASGNVYGNTEFGGSNFGGTAFKIVP
jgi:uncharacterized repeat protein (TIGR03803 family)